MQGQYSRFNSTVHPKEIQSLNKGMKYILIGTASALSVLGLTFSGFMLYGVCASWQTSNISDPSAVSTDKSLAATQSSIGQSPSSVVRQDATSSDSSTEASARSLSTSSRNSTTSTGKGIGIRVWE